MKDAEELEHCFAERFVINTAWRSEAQISYFFQALLAVRSSSWSLQGNISTLLLSLTHTVQSLLKIEIMISTSKLKRDLIVSFLTYTFFFVKVSVTGETCADSSDVFLFAAGRGQQPIDIRLSVMAVTRRGLPIESITGAEALVESCGDGEPQKKKRATEQSISSSRGETLGSPVYER
ncbi:UNVERIFIED_CONTAM: hypothetical protein FKN15_069247 [Acipenser sinensis]